MARSATQAAKRFPVIGIDCSSDRPREEVVNPGSCYQLQLPLYYVNAVLRAGGLPLVLPLIEDKKKIIQMLDHIDGLMLSGGYDVDPGYFGQEPHPKLGQIDVARDRFESVIVPYALEKTEMPIFGICRGIQAMNVFAGGTLHQDLSLAGEELVKHQQKTDRPLPTHYLNIEPGSWMHRIFGKKKLRTNTYHHQVVDRVAPGFVVTARSTDGLIEAIEMPGDRFVVGFQPHPERLEEEFKEFRKIFRTFVKASEDYARKRR